jgi:hypothetical protein
MHRFRGYISSLTGRHARGSDCDPPTRTIEERIDRMIRVYDRLLYAVLRTACVGYAAIALVRGESPVPWP